MPPSDEENAAEATPAASAQPTERSQARADKIIVVLLVLVAFVVVVGTIGSLWNQAIRVDVAVVGALLTALSTYAIAGKLTGK